MRYLKLPPSAVVVVHDEVDLVPARYGPKSGGSDADITACVRSRPVIGFDYRRVRIGVGHPGSPDRVPFYVLHDSPKPIRSGQAADRGNCRAAPYLAPMTIPAS